MTKPSPTTSLERDITMELARLRYDRRRMRPDRSEYATITAARHAQINRLLAERDAALAGYNVSA